MSSSAAIVHQILHSEANFNRTSGVGSIQPPDSNPPRNPSHHARHGIDVGTHDPPPRIVRPYPYPYPTTILPLSQLVPLLLVVALL